MSGQRPKQLNSIRSSFEYMTFVIEKNNSHIVISDTSPSSSRLPRLLQWQNPYRTSWPHTNVGSHHQSAFHLLPSLNHQSCQAMPLAPAKVCVEQMEGIDEEQRAAHIMLLDDVQDSLLTFFNVSIKTKLQCVFLRKSFGAKQERSSFPSEFKTRESSGTF